MAQDTRPAPNAHTVPAKESYGTVKAAARFTRGMIVATCIEHAGFRGDDAMRLMLQVAYAESGWVFNRVSSTGDYGLFQINKKAWPQLFAKYDWQNPLDNARMAREVFDRQGIGAWVAYKNGSYKRALGQAEQALREYKTLSQNHRLAILDAYKSSTGLARGIGFSTEVIKQLPPAAAKKGVATITDGAGGAIASVNGAIAGLGSQFVGIANNALGVIVAIVLLILGVFTLFKARGR